MMGSKTSRGILWIAALLAAMVLCFPKGARAQAVQDDAGANGSQADASGPVQTGQPADPVTLQPAQADAGVSSAPMGRVVRVIESGNQVTEVIDPSQPAAQPVQPAQRNARTEVAPSVNGWNSDEVPPVEGEFNLPSDPTDFTILNTRGVTTVMDEASRPDSRAFRLRMRMGANHEAPSADPVQRAIQVRRLQCSAACYRNGERDAALQAMCIQHNWPHHVPGFGDRISCVGAANAFMVRQNATILAVRDSRDMMRLELGLYAQEAQGYSTRIAQLTHDLEEARAHQGSPARVQELETQLAAIRAQLDTANVRLAEMQANAAETAAASHPHVRRRARSVRPQGQTVRASVGVTVPTRRQRIAPVGSRVSPRVSMVGNLPGPHWVSPAAFHVGGANGFECSNRTIVRDGHSFTQCSAGNGTDLRRFARLVPASIRADREVEAIQTLEAGSLTGKFRPETDPANIQGGVLAVMEANGGRIILACHAAGSPYFMRRFGVHRGVNHNDVPVTFASYRTLAPANCSATELWVPNGQLILVPMGDAPAAQPVASPEARHTARRSIAPRAPVRHRMAHARGDTQARVSPHIVPPDSPDVQMVSTATEPGRVGTDPVIASKAPRTSVPLMAKPTQDSLHESIASPPSAWQDERPPRWRERPSDGLLYDWAWLHALSPLMPRNPRRSPPRGEPRAPPLQI